MKPDKPVRGCIIVPLRIDRGPDFRSVALDVDADLDPVVNFSLHKRRKVSVDPVILHDIFHHTALDLGFDTRGELLTTYLDMAYPWARISRETNQREIQGWRNDLRAEGGVLPARRDIKALHERARARLGYLKPRAYLPRLQKAFETFLPAHPRTQYATLVVDVDARRVHLTPGRNRYAYFRDQAV